MKLSNLPPEAQESARQEVKLLGALDHRNIVKYFDSFEGDSLIDALFYICMSVYMNVHV